MIDWRLVMLIIGLLSTLGCMAIARQKNRHPGIAFVMGLMFGPIALIIYALMPRDAPPGMRRVICPRCDTRQNVPDGEQTYECWQCKLVSPMPDELA